MYVTSGLESRIGSYSSSSYANRSNGLSPAVNYSKLELKAAPELMQDYSKHRIEVINLDKPLQVISSNISGFNKYLRKRDYLTKSKGYSAGAYSNSSYNKKFMPDVVERFNPNSFLSDKRAAVQFIGSATEIQETISEAFMKTTGLYFPSDIIVRVCDDKQMKFFNNDWNPSISGFCFNRKGFGMSEVFVLQGELDSVMLTIGHEIGHCLSLPLENPRDEEAKAFAFSIAWAKKIKEHNIGDLAMNIDFNPAKNGLHDIALSFVFDMIKKGNEALDIYKNLVTRQLSMEVQNELCIGC